MSSAWVSSEGKYPTDKELHQWLFLTHHSWKSNLEASWISDPLPSEIKIIRSVNLTEEEITLDSVCYSSWVNLAPRMLLQWRWDNDREALLFEEQENRERIAEQSRLYAQKQEEILRTTALESLASKQWFSNWDESWETALREKSIGLILALLASLQDTPKLTKTQVRCQLRRCVKDFNNLDEELGNPIQTTHCEDIMNALELIAVVVKHPALIDEVDNWREW